MEPVPFLKTTQNGGQAATPPAVCASVSCVVVPPSPFGCVVVPRCDTPPPTLWSPGGLWGPLSWATFSCPRRGSVEPPSPPPAPASPRVGPKIHPRFPRKKRRQ